MQKSFATSKILIQTKIESNPPSKTKSILKSLISMFYFGVFKPSDGRLQREMGELDLTSRYTVDQVEHWLSRSALLLSMFDCVMHACFPVSFVSTDSIG